MAGYRVLVVDDQRDVRRVLATGIASLGPDFDVIEIPSGEEAMLEASRRPIDLLVADVRLPGISGLELMTRIRKRNPDLKIILITGVDDQRIRRQVAKAGADAFFYKPVEMADFLDAVERCLGLVQTIFPMPPIAAEAEASGAPAPTLAERLASLRQDLNAIAVALLDEGGQVIAQAGDLLAVTGETALLPALMSALNAGVKVAHVLGVGIPENLLCFTGVQYSLWAAQIGPAHALLIVTRDTLQASHLSKIGQSVLPAALEIQQILASLGESLPIPVEKPAPVPVEVEEAPEEPVEIAEMPELEALFSQGALQELTPEALDAFWTSALEQNAPNNVLSADTLTFEQARKLGLAPGEEKK